MTISLDQGRVNFLTKRFMGITRAHLKIPREREHVLEVLNALACTLAYVLAGTGTDNDAWKFFANAVNTQLARIEAEIDAAVSDKATSVFKDIGTV